MAETLQGTERVVRVADINPRHRHVIVFQLFEHLAPGNSLQLVVDHDPKPLRFQLEARHGTRCDWSYLEEGPDVWRATDCFRRLKAKMMVRVLSLNNVRWEIASEKG